MPDSWFFEALPYRPAPYPDECLSGYLLRLAEANGFAQFWDLASDLFPGWSYPGQASRLRWEYPVEDWRRLLQRTQLSVDALRALTVAPLVEKFRPPLDQAAHYGSPGVALHGVAQPNLQVCPLCLQAEPYLPFDLAPGRRLGLPGACVSSANPLLRVRHSARLHRPGAEPSALCGLWHGSAHLAGCAGPG